MSPRAGDLWVCAGYARVNFSLSSSWLRWSRSDLGEAPCDRVCARGVCAGDESPKGSEAPSRRKTGMRRLCARTKKDSSPQSGFSSSTYLDLVFNRDWALDLGYASEGMRWTLLASCLPEAPVGEFRVCVGYAPDNLLAKF